MPANRSGWTHDRAMREMGIVEVLLARIASSRSTPARASKMPVLIASFSVTASITTLQSASGARLMDVLRSEAIWADSAASACPVVLLLRPAASCRARAEPESSMSWFTSTMVVETPERIRVAAIPAPIWPAPSTPARKAIDCMSVPLHSTGDGPTQAREPDRSGLGREKDDLDPARRKLCQGGILQAQNLGAEADRGDLARSEPPGRVDSVLLDQILAYGVGLLLGQDLGKVEVVVIVGEGGDDDLRLWLAGLIAPAPDLVEAGAADGVRMARPGSNSSSS